MSYFFYGINSAVKYAKDGCTKELSDFLSKKPYLVNQRNKNGNTVLHIACWKGHEDMVLMLLMRGSDVNSTDSKGYSPLLVAIEFRHYNLALTLLQRGADISIGNQAMCLPLHVAALSGCKNIIIPLLERGADINATETNGCTPLLCALRGKHSDVAIILIDKGADLTARDRDDWLPVDLARTNGMTAVVAAISLRFECQSVALSRSASVLIPASEDKSDRQRKLLHTQPVSMESIHPREVQRVGQGEDIDVSRSQSQPSLFHTMSADCSATVVSIGAMSKASKISKSSKSKRKERRASVSEMSTVATTAAIEAVTQAMQACGGDVAKAALLLMQQQPVIKDGTKRRSKKKEDKSDDVSLSVSVLSDDTSRSGKAHRGSKKKKSPSKDIGAGNVQDKFDDCERSLRSSSTRGSRSSLRNARRSGSSSSVDDDDFLRESFSRGKSDRGSSLMPIEEEVVIRGGSRTSYHSNGRSGRRRGQNGESVGDDVDSDGELIGPPTIFCFWNKPVSKTALQPQSRVVPPALVSKSKASCLVM